MKKTPDISNSDNYKKLRQFFDLLVEDSARFEMVYACGENAGLSCGSADGTQVYSSYGLGFDADAGEIVILPVDKDLIAYGKPLYIKCDSVKKARRSIFSGEVSIWDDRLPKKRINFHVQEDISHIPDDIVIQVEQSRQAQSFHKFFKDCFKDKIKSLH